MRRHGALGGFENMPPNAPDDQSRRTQQYRNFLGPADADAVYKGLGDPRLNRRMLRWLVTRHMDFYNPCWPTDEESANAKIPAGYTYFAQLVIHDSVQSLAPLPELGGTRGWHRNERANRLMLDTVYGGGPAAFPLGYARDVSRGDEIEDDRVQLRLSDTRPAEMDPDGPVGIARDVPRLGCPRNGNGDRANGLPDVLIADPRNDDNVILSQMTMLFHLLHNWICEQLELAETEHEDCPDDGSCPHTWLRGLGPPWSAYRRFLAARKVVTLIYRRIVFDDLLAKILHPEICATYREIGLCCESDPAYDPYEEDWPGGFVETVDDDRMPLEFSHAAGRFGHVMVRRDYTLNGSPLFAKGRSATEILRHTSADAPRAMPLTTDWLVDWSFLFENPSRERNFERSRKLGPSFALQLIQTLFPFDGDPTRRSPGEGGGLPYRDLVRAAEGGVRSVKALIEQQKLLPAQVLDASPLVERDGKNASGWRIKSELITCWLARRLRDDGDDVDDEKAFAESVVDDPPLMFFILLEALHTQVGAPDARDNGECLGAIGSVLFGEFLYQERRRTHHIIEGDDQAQEIAACLFPSEPGSGERHAVPASMPQLIANIARQQGWEDDAYRFW